MVNSNDMAISSIWIFPIKSCKGTQIEVSGYTETGLDFDREWMVVEEKTHRFLTARVIGRMVLIHPTISLETRTLSIFVPAYAGNEESTHTIPLDIDLSKSEMDSDFFIWGSSHEAYSVGDDNLRNALSGFMGKRVLLVQKGESVRSGGYDLDLDECTIKFNDAFPILMVSESSLSEVQSRINLDSRVSKERWGKDKDGIEIERFRGNLVISNSEEWIEDGWSNVLIGEEELIIGARCARCMLPNVDPADGIRDKVVPDLILRPYRQTFKMMGEKVCFGVNAIPKSNRGIIKVGDKIVVKKYFDKDERGIFIRPEDSLESKKAFSD